MPRPRNPGAVDPKRRSRNGCWPCKTRKVKCDETHPACLNCQRQGEICDYSIRLNWEGRGKKRSELAESRGQMAFSSYTTPSIVYEPSQQPSFGAHMVTPFQSSNSGPAPTGEILDPALTSPIVPAPTAQNVWPYDSKYTQSYERYMPSEFSNKKHLAQTAEKEGNELISPLQSSCVGYNVRVTSSDSISYDHGFQTFDKNATDASSGSSDVPFSRPTKRVRYQQLSEANRTPKEIDMPPPDVIFPYNGTSTSSQVPLLRGSTVDTSTPSTVSTPGEDSFKAYSTKLSPYLLQSSDPRRLSVESLLSGPPGMGYDQRTPTSHGSISDIQSPSTSLDQEELTTWGIDRGFKDLDVGKNDDTIAISGGSPLAYREEPEFWIDDKASSPVVEFGFGVQAKDTAFEGGGYYAQPIPIQIPRSFEPLPAALLGNPMNLLYFHHFISHTARILVPHHCSSNPFQNILPKMAVRDPDLMSLLLAYSASHRARLLQHPEPATRIALWVQDIFPNLRHALNDPTKIMSLSSLATAIMLASLEIISPKAFGIEVSWKLHLDIARQVIAARGGWRTMNKDQSPVTYFLLRWFAYLDVLGSLVGGLTDPPSSTCMTMDTEYHMEETHDEYRIDCLFGFTGRCITILARIAALARGCAADRLGPDHNIRSDWEPPEKIKEQAEKLILDTEDAMFRTRIKPCPHLHSAGEATDQWDNIQMTAVNEAYHWAGLVHLHRLVLGKPSDHPDIQNAVRAILGALWKVRRGSTAEACLLFPMFTAGCDAQDEKQRGIIIDRLLNVEKFGMSQVHKARKLMEKVWKTGKPWETLVCGEFVG